MMDTSGDGKLGALSEHMHTSPATSDSIPLPQNGAPLQNWPETPVTGLLVLADGTVIKGQGLGAEGSAPGEVCFNTSITGYQEILTDPSYAGQIITFTFPHIGNVGTNIEDIETLELDAECRCARLCAAGGRDAAVQLPLRAASRRLAEIARHRGHRGAGHAGADAADPRARYAERCHRACAQRQI